MVFYLLFSLALALLVIRFLRAGNFREKSLFGTFFLFLILTFAMHPWIEKSSGVLRTLQNLTLVSCFFWLATEPFLAWREKRAMRKNIFSLLRAGKGPLFEIVAAARLLSEAKQGGLIAVERKDSLGRLTQSGVPVEARVRRETIFSIFTPPGALHDGGIIIQSHRIAAAGVLFPLSKRMDLPTELGTRHRAGLGLSEATDALVIVISEETGKISLAVDAKLLYDVKFERLAELLEASLKNKPVKHRQKISNSKFPFSSPEPVLRYPLHNISFQGSGLPPKRG